MSDDRARVTVRLPEDAYEELCAELPSFSADTSRFQFLVQFYLDYKQLGHAPRCKCETTTDGGTPVRDAENPPSHDRSRSDSDVKSNTDTENRPEAEKTPQRNANPLSSNGCGQTHSRELDQQVDRTEESER